MNQQQLFKILNIIEITCLIVVILSGAYIIYFAIWEPSYMSYTSECVPNGEQIVQDNGYVTAAYFVPSTKEIYIDTNYSNTEILITRSVKHEFVHLIQDKNNRLWSCDAFNGLGRIGNEVEAKLSEYYPLWFYKIFYGNPNLN